MSPKLVKADYHGAIITGTFHLLYTVLGYQIHFSTIPFIVMHEFLVSKSKCPGYVGLSGILLQETKNVFKIITKQDEIKSMDIN